MVKVFWTAFWVFLIDRITKAMSVGIETTNILPFLNFVYVENTGAAFGIFPNGRWLFVLITFVVLFLVYKYKTELMKISPLATGLIVGGAVANLFDRLFLGYVIDFVDFYIGNAHWPAFNVADSVLVFGVLYLCFKDKDNK